jgi:hypothetical protein
MPAMKAMKGMKAMKAMKKAMKKVVNHPGRFPPRVSRTIQNYVSGGHF